MLSELGYEYFTHITDRISARGRGLLLSQIGDAVALARALDRETPDERRVELFAKRLELEPEDLPR